MGKDIGNVIILVHGIGEKMWSEEGEAVDTASLSLGSDKLQAMHPAWSNPCGYESKTRPFGGHHLGGDLSPPTTFSDGSASKFMARGHS